MEEWLLVYSYHPVTGEFLGTDQAFADQMQPGEYIIPANATATQPPNLVDGKFRKWTGTEWVHEDIPAPPEPTTEEKAAIARQKRNGLLYASDWTQVPDVPAWVNVVGYAAYRQQLRDVPQQAGFPDSITWPTEPPRLVI